MFLQKILLMLGNNNQKVLTGLYWCIRNFTGCRQDNLP